VNSGFPMSVSFNLLCALNNELIQQTCHHPPFYQL
jgi:hypothetical protein